MGDKRTYDNAHLQRKSDEALSIFENNYLIPNNLKYTHYKKLYNYFLVTTDDSTILYHAKGNYYDDEILVIEDYWNTRRKKRGSWYKTEADVFVFISLQTKSMIFLQLTDDVKKHYEKIKSKYRLVYNTILCYQPPIKCAYRHVPLKEFEGYYNMWRNV